MSNHHHIIIFDGVCNFCSGAVNFIIQHDHADVFLFTPLQSPTAQRLLWEYQMTEEGADTLILIKNNRCYFRTNAVFEITKDLGGRWSLLKILRVLPRPLRDFSYRIFARNRYKIFGKQDHCMVPTPELKDRFLW
jgi:predicted DCC family thiol-disulfide oxidoreductase YuxK